MKFVTETREETLERIQQIGTAMRGMSDAIAQHEDDITYREAYAILESPYRLLASVFCIMRYHGISEMAGISALVAGLGDEMCGTYNIGISGCSEDECPPERDNPELFGAYPKDMGIDLATNGRIIIRALEQFNQKAKSEAVTFAVDLLKAHEEYILTENKISEEEFSEYFEKARGKFWFGSSEEHDIVNSEFYTMLNYGITCKNEIPGKMHSAMRKASATGE